MEQQCKNCLPLFQELVKYKEESLAEKEAMKKEIEKYRLQLEKFTTKVDKRIQTRLKEDRNVNAHRMEELEQFFEQESCKLKGLLEQKDRMIDEMRQLVRVLQSQKRELIQNNTQVLVELSQGIDTREEQPSQVMDHSYKELMKMYQFLIEENNQLKKQVYLLQKQNLNHSSHVYSNVPMKNQSFVIREEKSLNTSDYKSRPILDHSKGQAPVSIKPQPPKEKAKEKTKKPPVGKHRK